MSNANLYGRIVSPTAVEHAVVASLQIWLDSAIGELERIDGYPCNTIERPHGIVTSSQFEKWPEDQIPVVLVINTGLAGPPARRADGIYDAAWLVGCAPVVSDVDHAGSRDLALTYTAAIRMALLQHAQLKSGLNPTGFAHYVDWRGEDYTDMPFLNTRSLAAGRVIFEVGVESAVNQQAGPRTPPLDPCVDPGPWPNVGEPTVTFQPVPIGATLP